VWLLSHDGLRPHDPDTVQAVVLERLRVGGLLLSRSLLDGWAEPLAGFPDPPAPSASTAGPRRNLYFSLLRFADGWVLYGPGGGYRISEGMARLWSCLDGRPQTGLRAALGEAAGLAGVTDDDVAAAVCQLRERGLAESACQGGQARPARPGGPLSIADSPDPDLDAGVPAGPAGPAVSPLAG
jgi:hypothetical protein